MLIKGINRVSLFHMDPHQTTLIKAINRVSLFHMDPHQATLIREPIL
jgi:hypothetical protein